MKKTYTSKEAASEIIKANRKENNIVDTILFVTGIFSALGLGVLIENTIHNKVWNKTFTGLYVDPNYTGPTEDTATEEPKNEQAE